MAGESVPIFPDSGDMVDDHDNSKRPCTARVAATYLPWLWVVMVCLLWPKTGFGQSHFPISATGLTGIRQVQFGNEIQIYATELADLGGPGVPDGDLGRPGLNTGIQLTISDLTTTTGLVSGDFHSLRLYSSVGDGILDDTDTFMAFVSPVNIGAITEIDATAAGADRRIPDNGSVFFIISARISTQATGGHAFRVGAAINNIGLDENGGGAAPGDIGLPVLADDANHIVLGGAPAKKLDGTAVTIPFGGENAILFLLVSSGAYALRRRT